jgi:hypothetical protein
MDNRPTVRRAIPPLLLCAWLVLPASAQDSSPPDVLVDLNEGIYLYLHQPPGRVLEGYREAIDRLTRVLEREPVNEVALLFRALSHGQIGLRHRWEKVRAEVEARERDDIIRIRVTPGLQEEKVALMARYDTLLEDESLSDVERTVTVLNKRRIENLLELVEDYAGETTAELETEAGEKRRRLHQAALEEADAYVRMIMDVRALLGLLDQPADIIRLLEAVGLSKIARIREGEAVRLRTYGDLLEDMASGPIQALRAEARDLLEQTAALLEQVLRDKPQGQDALRAEFFLGVIRFRQAVPLRAADEAPRIDRDMLSKSKRLMLKLAGDEETDALWRSYAALYLGMILPFEGSMMTQVPQRRAAYVEGKDWLYRAIELDPTKGEDPTSAPVARVAARQLEQIDELLAQAEGLSVITQQRNDITFSLALGPHYDTNVVLLGERTDLPRGVSREGDSAFTSGAVIDYTVDLDERWTLGLQGRMSHLWHCRVNEFDEQRYGGSVAVQYQALREEGDVGPVYLRLQYDYEYTLLGRSAFLDSHSLAPNVRMFELERRAETNLYFVYSIRDYHEPLYDRRLNRDGTYMTLGLLQSLKTLNMTEWYTQRGITAWGHENDDELVQDDPEHPDRYLTPFVGVRYGWDNTAGEEFDQKSFALLAGLSLPLPYGWLLDALADFEWQDYQGGSLIDYHRRPRRDLVQEYGLALSRAFVLRAGSRDNRFTPTVDRVVMTLSAHASWTLDDSNVVDRLGQAIFEYDRAIYGFSVAFSFN